MQLIDLGVAPYQEVLDLQLETVEKLIANNEEDSRFYLVEHPPVITLGKRGGTQYLGVSENYLKEKNVDVIGTGRGGFITYHGPGQLVAYPILRLKSYSLSVHRYVYLLEEAMIKTASEFGVTAQRDERNAGVWCAGKKLGSIGIAVRRGITYHGLALNVDLDLEPFSWLNPCGLDGVSMTSLANESAEWPDIAFAKEQMVKHLQILLQSHQDDC